MPFLRAKQSRGGKRREVKKKQKSEFSKAIIITVTTMGIGILWTTTTDLGAIFTHYNPTTHPLLPPSFLFRSLLIDHCETLSLPSTLQPYSLSPVLFPDVLRLLFPYCPVVGPDWCLATSIPVSTTRSSPAAGFSFRQSRTTFISSIPAAGACMSSCCTAWSCAVEEPRM